MVSGLGVFPHSQAMTLLYIQLKESQVFSVYTIKYLYNARMTEKKRKRGRPVGSTAEVVADEVLPPIRVRKDQLEAYRAAASKADKSLSGWVKDTLDKEVAR